MASRLTTICRNQEIAGSTPAVVIRKPFSLNELNRVLFFEACGKATHPNQLSLITYNFGRNKETTKDPTMAFQEGKP
jgi:hypothetical protein